MANEVGDLSRVIRRLDIFVNLLVEMRPEEGRKVTMRAKIQQLSYMGLSPAEIGNIVGWLPTSVSRELSKMKKAKKGGK